jgi:hypothetical protein
MNKTRTVNYVFYRQGTYKMLIFRADHPLAIEIALPRATVRAGRQNHVQHHYRHA